MVHTPMIQCYIILCFTVSFWLSEVFLTSACFPKPNFSSFPLPAADGVTRTDTLVSRVLAWFRVHMKMV